MNRASIYGTAVVLAHLLVTFVHGQAHQHLAIFLGPAGNSFVYLVILAAPLLAMVLLWTRFNRGGLALLGVSMTGALLFGIYMHFIAIGPDNVREVSGDWAGAFIWTSVALAILEAAGAYIGFHYFSLGQPEAGSRLSQAVQ